MCTSGPPPDYKFVLCDCLDEHSGDLRSSAQSVSHSIAWLLFHCLQQRLERSYSSFKNEDVILTITDTVYRLPQYRCRPIRYAYLDVSIWCLHPWVASPVTEELIAGFVALATWLHRISDFFLKRVVLAWGFVWLFFWGRCHCLDLPKDWPRAEHHWVITSG